MCYMSRRSEVGVRELRQNLSVYLARVKRGERLAVTERRRVVAVLAPVDVSDDPLSRLVATGRATPATRGISNLPRPLKRTLAKPLSRIVRDLGDDVV